MSRVMKSMMFLLGVSLFGNVCAMDKGICDTNKSKEADKPSWMKSFEILPTRGRDERIVYSSLLKLTEGRYKENVEVRRRFTMMADILKAILYADNIGDKETADYAREFLEDLKTADEKLFGIIKKDCESTKPKYSVGTSGWLMVSCYLGDIPDPQLWFCCQENLPQAFELL